MMYGRADAPTRHTGVDIEGSLTNGATLRLAAIPSLRRGDFTGGSSPLL